MSSKEFVPPFYVIVDEKGAGEFPSLELAKTEGQKLCDAEPLPSVWWIEDANGNHVTDIQRSDGLTLSQQMQRFNQRHQDPVEFAISHSPEAIGMHELNHPRTKQDDCSVWDLNPREVAGDHTVLAAHRTPGCQHFGQAKGGQPDGLQLLLRAAELHGQNNEPEHEVGDLQQILRAAWAVMSPAQRALLLKHEDVRPILVSELDGNEEQNEAAIQTAIQAELDAAATSGGPLGALLTEFPGFALDEEVDGGDLVEWMAQNLHLFGQVPQGRA